MHRITVAAVAATLVVSVACGCQRKKERPKDEPRKVTVLPVRMPLMRTISEELVDPGATPRTLLRYKPTPTRKHELVIEAAASLSEMSGGTKQPPMTLPKVTTRFSLAWRGGDGRELVAMARPARIESSSDASAVEAAQLLIARYQTELVGHEATLPTDDRGLIGSRPADDPSSVERARNYVSIIADLVVPFPQVPIGVGGRWQLVRTLPRARTNVKQTVTFTLLEKNGSDVVVAIEGRVVGERQPIDVPNVPRGAQAELVALRATVKGSLRVDLTVPAATNGELARSDTVHTQVRQGSRLLSEYFSESTSTVRISSAKR